MLLFPDSNAQADSTQLRDLQDTTAQSVADDSIAIAERLQIPQEQEPESWNQPRKNVIRILAVYWSFLVFGLNDGAYGALLPYLEAQYHLSDTVVSLIFLSPLLGYTAAALLNSTIHIRFGQRGIAILASCCHIAAYAAMSAQPPYPVLIVMYAIAGFGYGLIDGAWNVWTGNMKNANAVQGLLSACYSLGAMVSPMLVTTMCTKQDWGWYTFYWVMTGCATISLTSLSFAFWGEDGSVHRRETRNESRNERHRTKAALKVKVTWIGAAYFFIYFGTQITLGGWIVSFMLRVRHASPRTSGISATGFQAGQTIGRAILGLTTSRVSVSGLWFRLVMTCSLVCAVALQLTFWLIPSLFVSAFSVALLGFFLGPLFPAGVVVLVNLLPRHLQVATVGIATALGGTGGAIFPFLVGAIIQAGGIKLLQPTIFSLLLGVLALWLVFPRRSKRRS